MMHRSAAVAVALVFTPAFACGGRTGALEDTTNGAPALDAATFDGYTSEQPGRDSSGEGPPSETGSAADASTDAIPADALGDGRGPSLDASQDDASVNDAESLADASGDASLPPSSTTAVAYQIDPGHSGWQPNDTLTPPLTQRWSVNLGGPVSYPLVAGGRVFVSVAHTATYGTDLYALDQATGAIVWGPTNLGGTYYWSGAAYEGGKVFAVNFDGLLRAYDAASGSQLWMTQLPGQYAFSSPPTAAGGTVFVGGAGSGGTLYAVDEKTGNVLWQEEVENGDNSSPAVSSSGVYVSYACTQAYAFAPATGAQLWHFAGNCEGGGGRTPALFGGRVYVRDFVESNVVLDPMTGASLGTFIAGSIPAFDGTRMFSVMGAALTASTLPAFGAAWTFSGDGHLVTAPVVVNGFVYVGSSLGQLYALDEALGTTAWSVNLGAALAGPDEQNVSQPLTGLAAAGGALIVPASGSVFAYW
jgi:outer membrane protein assembly factor BamB